MSELYPGGAPSEEGVWHSLNRVLGALIALGVIIGVICAYVPRLQRGTELNTKVEELRAEIAREKTLLTRQTRELALLQNDRVYLETLARDRLDLMKDGETIYRFDAAPPQRPAEKPKR